MQNHWDQFPQMTIRPITPTVVGCVIYRSPFSNRYHQTGFVLHIFRRDPTNPNTGLWIDADGPTVAMADLKPTLGFMNGYAD